MAPAPRGDGSGGAPAVRWPRIARFGVVVILTVLALVTAAIPTVWILMGREPSWWRGPGAPSESVARGAEAVERAFSAELARHHEAGHSWSIDVTEDAANAWLNHRLPLWLEHEGIELPWPVEAISARFGPGTIRLGAARPRAYTPRIVGITVEPRIDAISGAVRATVRGLHFGAVSIPGILADRAAAVVLGSGGGDALGHTIDGDRTIELRPIRLNDGRRVTLVGISVHPGRVRVTFRASEESAPGGLGSSGGLP